MNVRARRQLRRGLAAGLLLWPLTAAAQSAGGGMPPAGAGSYAPATPTAGQAYAAPPAVVYPGSASSGGASPGGASPGTDGGGGAIVATPLPPPPGLGGSAAGPSAPSGAAPQASPAQAAGNGSGAPGSPSAASTPPGTAPATGAPPVAGGTAQASGASAGTPTARTAPGGTVPAGASPAAAQSAAPQTATPPAAAASAGAPGTQAAAPADQGTPLPDTWVPRATAVLQVLNKETAAAQTLTVPVGQAAKVGPLTITVRACVVRPPTMPGDAAAFLAIADTAAKDEPPFQGWSLRNEPFLSMYQNPLYDVRVLGCRT